MNATINLKANRGFAGMTPEQRRTASSKGGRTTQARGTAHRWNSETGKVAGRKGGQAPRPNRGKKKIETD